GINAEDVVKNTVSALNSSVNFKPSFWIDEKNGNHYYVGVTYPEIELDNPQSVENISLRGTNGASTLLKNISKTSLTSAPIEINHLDIQRVTDVFANVEGRDIGSAASEIENKLAALRKQLPEGYKIDIRGEVQSMKEGFGNLGMGLGLAILLVYLVIVPLLRSFKLPLIIVTVIPLGLIGVTIMLLATNTYLNIQSMMGIIMMVGITVAYSNLLVDKMNNLLKEGKPLDEAIKEGIANRFRPIIMTAIVAILALLPMALGYETGGEANVPLARAIIGGYLKQLRADIGSFVKEGQVLAVLENPDLYREKERIQAELTEKSALYFRLKNNREQTMVGADIEAKRALYDRLKSIYEKTPQLTSISDVEKAEGDYKRALAQATDELDINSSAYQSANARLKNINMQISYLWIKAPFSGVITNRFADKGALIHNGLNTNSSMPLFELQDCSQSVCRWIYLKQTPC
ncbi:MAG: efflux RND transporter permease subunit, partial [Chitinophagaceae bacterium]